MFLPVFTALTPMLKSYVFIIPLRVLLFLRFADFGHTHFASTEEADSSSLAFDYPTTKCGLRRLSLSDRSLASLRYEHNENLASVTDDERNLDKILGGSYVVHGEIPWQASIRTPLRMHDRLLYMHVCGGVIISEFWILSAAHCYFDKDPHSFIVAVGDHNLNRWDRKQMFELDKIIIHELYHSQNRHNDIALIKIKPTSNGRGIEFNNVVQTICLPDSAELPADGIELLVSGWGQYSASGVKPSQILRQTILPVISAEHCKQMYHKYFTDRILCAGYVDGDTDLCKGDSGGPAVCKSGDVYILYGIVSFGTGCSMPNYPAVLTSVPAFLSWIESNIGRHSDSNLQRIIPSRPFD